MPKEFRVKPDTKPSKGFGRLADKSPAWFWDIMECNGSAADPHPISRASKVHTLSLDSIKSKVEGGKMVSQLLVPPVTERQPWQLARTDLPAVPTINGHQHMLLI